MNDKIINSLCYESIKNRYDRKSSDFNKCYHYENEYCRYKRITKQKNYICSTLTSRKINIELSSYNKAI